MKERNELLEKINALLVCLNLEKTNCLEKLSTPVLRGIYCNLIIKTLNSYYEEVL